MPGVGVGQKRKGQSGNILPRERDPKLLERMNRVIEMRSRGEHIDDIAAALGISTTTVKVDWRRGVELYREEVVAKVDAHVARLERLLVKSWKMLEESDSRSLNRSAILGQIRQTVMDIAKLDGSLIERKEVDGTLTVRDLIASLEARNEKTASA